MKKSNKIEFILKAKKVHGNKYDYSNVKYINVYTKICIICPVHGEFMQTPNKHISAKCGCNKCKSVKARLTSTQLLEKCNNIHYNKYTYDFSNYKSYHDKFSITCPTHGQFYQAPHEHIYKRFGCPLCKSIDSKGVQMIERFMVDNKIEYVREYRFDNCRDKHTLPFDFYIPKYNLLIEFDGEHHYIFREHWHKDEAGFEAMKNRDLIKNKYANDKGIGLIRIKYDDINQIPFILAREIF